ncbi:hypothetical protein MNBD_PLANCTO03-2385 [hydrothermal vent metagenome]|uniref:peptidylprolyl isomerase n=1 Tax=hydrothermal vent metagenome TaxID=652676 RepID=A0A3B1DMM3_9ZZZZ
MKKIPTLLLTSVMLLGLPAAVLGQDDHAGHNHAKPAANAAAQPPAEPAPERGPMVWSEPDFAAIAEMMIGSWQTTAPVAQADDPTQTAKVVMSIAPANLTELPDTLYIETARSDSIETPYRAAFLQLYRRQGELRMRTLEIRAPGASINDLLIGLWAAPEFIPDIPREAMIATLDLAFTKVGDAWVGQTPYPYPTAVGGAVEMTSQMKIEEDTIETADRGYAADGSVVWGSSAGDHYTFERIDSPYTVDRRENGLVVITLRDNTDSDPFSEGDRVAFQYSGWLTTGRMFDTSRRQNGKPLSYTAPGNLIPGWMMATEGMSNGDWRKFIVPSEIGYGDKSAARGAIPPNSTLVFEAECVSVQPGFTQPNLITKPAGGGGDGHEGHDH